MNHAPGGSPPGAAAPPRAAASRTAIAVIGAGFTGTMLALHLLRRCPEEVDVLLIEGGDRFGPGLAYGTRAPEHLLNVPTARMGAFPHRPTEFLEWVRERRPEAPQEIESFVPRRLYAEYLTHLLNEELVRPGAAARLTLIRGRATGLASREGGVALTLADGRALDAGVALLALGNSPPARLDVIEDGLAEDPSAYRPDPWRADALAGLDAEDPVLLVGTGLTMADVALSLLARGHRGTIHALSRRGLLPARHAAAPPPSHPPARDRPPRLMDALREVRAEAAAEMALDGDWRPVMEALRPVTRALWEGFTDRERRAFLRHLRPYWDMHRHRLPGPAADRIAAARASRQLRVHAGRIIGCVPAAAGAEVAFRPRGEEGQRRLTVRRIVNCTGPASDLSRTGDPLLDDLFARGLARPDALRLGLDVGPMGALIGADGVASDRFFAAGPLTRGRHWEMTAVPDIRQQCADLARQVAGRLRAASS